MTKRVYDPDAGVYLDVEVRWNGQGPLPGQSLDGSAWRTTSSRLLDYAPVPDSFVTQREARYNLTLPKPAPKRTTCRQCFNRKALRGHAILWRVYWEGGMTYGSVGGLATRTFTWSHSQAWGGFWRRTMCGGWTNVGSRFESGTLPSAGSRDV